MNFQVEHDHHFHSFSPVLESSFWLLRWQPWTFGQCLESILANGFPVIQIRIDLAQVSWLCFAYVFSFAGAIFYAVQQTKLFARANLQEVPLKKGTGGLASGLVDWSTGHDGHHETRRDGSNKSNKSSSPLGDWNRLDVFFAVSNETCAFFFAPFFSEISWDIHGDTLR